MRFLWPDCLWLLLLLPLAVAAYVWLQRRRKRAALRYASLTFVRDAMTPGRSLRRHVPPLLFLVALALLLVAIARPAAIVTLPTDHETIILAIDVSGSMRAEDIKPTRLAAAQAAARAFIADQPSNVDIGIVSFAGTAAVVQAPTQNRDDLLAAVDRLQLQRATAVGSGILVALKLVDPTVRFDLRFSNPRLDVGDANHELSLDERRAEAKPAPKPLAPGSNTSAAIILLTDGQTTTGPDPIEAARLAADRGVRVYTVGIGTVDGETIGFEGWSMRVRLDEDTLKAIAQKTNAEYFYAGTASDLKKVYETLSTKLTVEKKETEISALFALGAAVLTLLSAGLSLLWFNRIL